MTDKLYSIVEIAELGGIAYRTASERIKKLEIFPDEIKSRRFFYSKLKLEAVIGYRKLKYEKKTYYYKIYESKMNYEN